MPLQGAVLVGLHLFWTGVSEAYSILLTIAVPMGKSGKDKKKGRNDDKGKDMPRKESRRSRPALQRRRRSPSVRGKSVELESISPISAPLMEARRNRLRARIAPLRGSVVANAGDPEAVVRRRPAGMVSGPEANPPIWLWRKAWRDHYQEAGGTWRMLEVKREDAKVHELWQWEED